MEGEQGDMGSRVHEHVRSNIVGYVAVFLALSGGAYALDGRNTVDSGDIRKGQVKRPDLANDAVNSPKVAPDSLSGQDIAEGTLGQVPSAQSALSANAAQNSQTLNGLGSDAFLRNAPNVVGSAEVVDDSLGGADVNEASLAGGWATVSETGTVQDQSGGITPLKISSGDGLYLVDFGEPLGDLGLQATNTGGFGLGQVTAIRCGIGAGDQDCSVFAGAPGNVNNGRFAHVSTQNSAGGFADRAFTVSAYP